MPNRFGDLLTSPLYGFKICQIKLDELRLCSGGDRTDLLKSSVASLKIATGQKYLCSRSCKRPS